MKLFQWLFLAVVSVVLIGCQGGSEKVSKEKTYDIKGTIVSIDAKKPSVKLDHQDVPGLMRAMVMEFDVANPKIVEGLKPGDVIQGKVKLTEASIIITEMNKP